MEYTNFCELAAKFEQETDQVTHQIESCIDCCKSLRHQCLEREQEILTMTHRITELLSENCIAFSISSTDEQALKSLEMHLGLLADKAEVYDRKLSTLRKKRNALIQTLEETIVERIALFN